MQFPVPLPHSIALDGENGDENRGQRDGDERAYLGSVPFILSKFVATWNGFPPRGLVSRRIALRHWRTTDVALACFTLYRSASKDLRRRKQRFAS